MPNLESVPVELKQVVEALEDTLRELLKLHKQGMDVALAVLNVSQAIEQLEEIAEDDPLTPGPQE